MELAQRYTISDSTKNAYDSNDNKLIHPGEKVYLHKSSNYLKETHTATIVSESNYKVEKIIAAVYAYQVDNGGEWSKIQLDLVEVFTENDPCDTWEITDCAIKAVLECCEGKLPKRAFIPNDAGDKRRMHQSTEAVLYGQFIPFPSSPVFPSMFCP